jgi:TolB-like protein/DNA-binding winged helix-turn-helix (wHTH) protein/Flp pilus assembly protein TadD
MSGTKPAARPVLVYRFGPYEVYTANNELRKFGLRVKLERKPLQLLIALVERAGEVVTRADLQRVLWGEDLFVDFDQGLNVAAAKLRATLNDLPEKPTYIETVSGAGYRFIAEVEEVVASATASAQAAALDGNGSEVKIPAQAEIGQGTLQAVVPVENGAQAKVPAEAEIEWVAPKDEFSVRPPSAHRSKAWLRIVVAACVVIIAVVLAKSVWRSLQQPAPVHAGRMMLVVLPFENLSGDPGQEYFSDGITEELSAQLGNLNPQRLGVIGRTSAMTYKHSHSTISQIGKDLGVGYVLEGSVRRDGSEIRVTAQLVEVSDQAHVWAQDYDRNARDLLQLEDDVASDIARQIGVSIALAPPPEPRHPHTPTPEAHEAYLIARYYWYKRTPDGWSKSEEYFRRAIEKDPLYAAAYAGLAECTHTPREEALAAARKAVDLDPTSGEAYAALGWVEFFKVWDYVAAAEALKTAIQLDPNYAPAHHIYSRVLDLSERFQRAIDEEKKAVLIDPLALIFRVGLAGDLSLAGQNDRAAEQINQIFAIDPKYPKAHETLGTIYLRRGMYKEAIREYENSERYGGGKELGILGYAYARLGDKQQALRILAELQDLEKRSPSGDVSSDLATVEIGLGDMDAALAWLEKEYRQHDSDGPWDSKVDPIFAPLRSDPRFLELMGRVKFPS